jgi:hypothetical protein
MRRLLLIVLVSVGCTRNNRGHEVSVEVGEAWRVGLTDEQALRLLKDEETCGKMYRKLRDAAGDPAKGSIEHLGLIRLKTHYDEYSREVQAGNLKTAAPYFLRQIEGKNLTDLAWEQSAEPSPRGR